MRRLSIPLLLLALGGGPTLAATPDPVVALLTQARDAQSRGAGELALRLAQSAIVAGPARPEAYVGLGDVYAAQGRADYARSYYDLALSIDPVSPAALKAVAGLSAQSRQAQNQAAQPGTP